MSKLIIINCFNCERKIKRTQNHINQNIRRGSNHYCLMCIGRFRGSWLIGNKNWLGRKHSEEYKMTMSKSRIGSGNPNWKGGVYKTNLEIRTSSPYKRMCKKVLKRDRMCYWCGSGDRLEIDHYFKKFSDCSYKEKIDPDICKVLCYECHKFKTTKIDRNPELDVILDSPKNWLKELVKTPIIHCQPPFGWAYPK